MPIRVLFLLIFLLAILQSHAQRRKFYLVARTTGQLTMHDGKEIPMYGFASSKTDAPIFPAPTISVTQGDTVEVEVTNISQQFQSVHFHGLDMLTAHGGNPVTSFAIAHRQKYTYRFIAQHSGSFLYYSAAHNLPLAALGMYGIVIVRSKSSKHSEKRFEAEQIWITSEIDPFWNNQLADAPEENTTVAKGKFAPEYFLWNGQSAPFIKDGLKLKEGQMVSLIIANAGLTDARYIFPRFIRAYLTNADGRPLLSHQRADTLLISPGQRYELLIHPIESNRGKILLEYISLVNNAILATKTIACIVEYERKELDKKDILISRTNLSNNLEIHFSKEMYSPFQLEIYNLLGQKIIYEQFSTVFNTQKFHLDAKALPIGNYYCKISIQGKHFYKYLSP